LAFLSDISLHRFESQPSHLHKIAFCSWYGLNGIVNVLNTQPVTWWHKSCLDEIKSHYDNPPHNWNNGLQIHTFGFDEAKILSKEIILQKKSSLQMPKLQSILCLLCSLILILFWCEHLQRCSFIVQNRDRSHVKLRFLGKEKGMGPSVLTTCIGHPIKK
jgi:hypothetical protein